MPDTAKMLDRYRRMGAMRAFDEACLDALRRKAIHGELHVGLGQEAIGAAMFEALQPGDAVVSTHRNHFHALAKGVDPRALLAEICERETGLCGGRGGHMHPFDPENHFSATGIVGASLPVALGYAHAFALRGEDHVAVGVTGDGGSHSGAFHETMVMASARDLPLVVLVENNALAISVDFAAVSPTSTVAERASAYDALGLHVDGTDVDAVTAQFCHAMDHARSGQGPVIIEATCCRFRGHFEGDPEHYRSRDERNRLRAEFDPIALYADRLTEAGVAREDLDAIIKSEKAAAKAMLAEVLADPLPDPADALAHVFVDDVFVAGAAA
ncbi:MAG: thiamine pyrophosphate-dependent dehydrogenase E1 component subunit alpha [Roseitalea sp.]|jgi:pyruvate dehydrogenase E1 component alpha subunit|nr:thiamine pyrophosphate-dependent dehydrogenase E1 component subunit alpha [Roseitalea sp.]MBO6723194.1 thiamine pyrophosphate-dependent dehydrogenase E1 component subunit alpha [Roseitalea sp.]MBO6745265.1 thiamine pyrophosphate-dependent dehydrogenase E1 component subunit alpha [Roseitalea sp.]